MKRLLLSTLIFTFCFSLTGQKVVDRFIDKKLKEKGAIALKLPGWLINRTANLVKNFSDEEESQYWELAKSIKNFRILALQNASQINRKELKLIQQELLNNEGFDEYLTVSGKNTHVRLYAKDEQDVIKNIVFIVNEDQDLVVLRIKTKLSLDAFADLNYELATADIQ